MKYTLVRSLARGLGDKFTTEERFVQKSTRRHLYTSAIVLVSLGGVLLLALVIQVMNNVGIVGVDYQIEKWSVGIRNPLVTTLASIMAVVFGPISLPLIVLLIMVLWIIFSTHAWRPLILTGFMGIGLTLVQVIAHLVQRHRPPLGLMLFGQDTSYSFPSGHVSATADFLLLLAYLIVSRKPTRSRVALAISIATIVISSQVFSRIYLGHHWLSDTLASICLAMIILGAMVALDTWRTVRVPGERVTGRLSKHQTEDT